MAKINFTDGLSSVPGQANAEQGQEKQRIIKLLIAQGAQGNANA